MTQEELAGALGVGRRTVQRWETGAPIPINHQARISALLARREANPLDAYASVELIAEVLRRLDPVKEPDAIVSLANLIRHLGDSR